MACQPPRGTSSTRSDFPCRSFSKAALSLPSIVVFNWVSWLFSKASRMFPRLMSRPLIIFADRDAADGPAEVRPGFAEVEVGERPVLGPAGEPQVRKVIADVRHHVRLGGDQILDSLDASGQVLRRRLRRCGGRSLLAAAQGCHEDEREHGQRHASPRSCSHFSSITIRVWACADSPSLGRTGLTVWAACREGPR